MPHQEGRSNLLVSHSPFCSCRLLFQNERLFFFVSNDIHTRKLWHAAARYNYRPDDKNTFWTACSDWTSSHGTGWTNAPPPSPSDDHRRVWLQQKHPTFRWLVCVLLFKSLKFNHCTSLIAIKRLCLSTFLFCAVLTESCLRLPYRGSNQGRDLLWCFSQEPCIV